MRYYETIIIYKPDITDDVIDKQKCDLQAYSKEKEVCVEPVGIKKLAYPIEAKPEFTQGYYVVFYWHGTSDNARELETKLKSNGNALKFITIEDEDVKCRLKTLRNPDPNPKTHNKSEQIDARDVLLGLANYKK